MTSPNRMLGYSNNQLNCYQVKSRFRLPDTLGFESLKLIFNLLTAF